MSGTPFHFNSERRLVTLTGITARNLRELAAGLRQAPESSILYHADPDCACNEPYVPTPANEFAQWVWNALGKDAAAKRLAGIRLADFTSVRELGDALIQAIEGYIQETGDWQGDCRPGDEFHFCRTHSVILATGVVARDPGEFFARLPEVSNRSICFHYFGARLRLGRATNDFSEWLTGHGEQDLARSIAALDRQDRSLDELKTEIVRLGEV